jgi:hypothetical protein
LSTQSTEIVDLFLSRIRDHRLDVIYTSSGSTTLTVYIEPWLIFATNEFSDYADQTLTYVTSTGSSVSGYFTEDLNVPNKVMLSLLMTKYWLEKTIKDIIQISSVITDRDFKTFSAAQNLKAKQDYYNSLQEEISQALINYAYKRNNFSNWYNQIFDSSYL